VDADRVPYIVIPPRTAAEAARVFLGGYQVFVLMDQLAAIFRVAGAYTTTDIH